MDQTPKPTLNEPTTQEGQAQLSEAVRASAEDPRVQAVWEEVDAAMAAWYEARMGAGRNFRLGYSPPMALGSFPEYERRLSSWRAQQVEYAIRDLSGGVGLTIGFLSSLLYSYKDGNLARFLTQVGAPGREKDARKDLLTIGRRVGVYLINGVGRPLATEKEDGWIPTPGARNAGQ